jgi:hypothetical protein
MQNSIVRETEVALEVTWVFEEPLLSKVTRNLFNGQ